MTVNIDIRLKTQGAQQSAADIAKIEKAYEEARRELTKFGDATTDANILRSRFSLVNLELKEGQRDARNFFQAIDKPAKELIADLKQVEQQANKAGAALKNAGNTSSIGNARPDGTFESFGDLSTATGAAGSALNSVGFQGAGSLAQAVGDLTGFAEQLPRLSSGLSGAGAAGLVLAGTMVTLNAAFADSRKGIEAAINAERDRIELLQFTRDEVSRLTAEETARKREELQNQLDDATALRDAARNQSFGAYTEQGAIGSTVGKLVNTITGTDEALKVIAEQTTIIEETSQKLLAITDALPLKEATEQGQTNVENYMNSLNAAAQQELDIYRAVRDLSSEAAQSQLEYSREQLRQQENNLSVLRDTIAASDKALADIANGVTVADPATLERLTTENEELKKAYDALLPTIQAERRAVEEYEQTVIPAIAARERETEVIKAQQAEVERLAKLELDLANKRSSLETSLKSVTKQIADFTANQADQAALKAQEQAIKDVRSAELSALDAKYAQLKAVEKEQQQRTKLAAIATETNAKVTEINQKYYSDNLKAVSDFNREEQRLREDANRERLRLIRDAEADLQDAARQNDVLGFINRQRQFSRDLGDLDSDTSTNAGRRAEDFRIATNEAIKARDEEVRKTVEAAQQKLQVETAAAQQSLTLDQRLAQEKAALQQRYAQEDLARTQALEQAKINMQLQAFNVLKNQLQAQISLNTSQMNVQRATRPDAQMAFGRYGQVGRSITAFGIGGDVQKPTFSLLGEREGWGDLVLPYQKSKGVGSALPPSVVVNLQGADFSGSSVTEEKVTGIVVGIIRDTVLEGMKQGRQATA